MEARNGNRRSLRQNPVHLKNEANLWRSETRLLFFAILAILSLVGGSTSFAQTTNATLNGTVTDSSGAVVVGAKVTLSQPATGRVIGSTLSNSSGGYEFNQLQPSTYALHCTAKGFQAFDATDILLDPGQIRSLNVTLAIGSATTQVTVSAGAAVINTQSAALSTTFSAKQLQNAPLINTYPSIYSLVTTTSGVQGGGGSFPVMNGQQQTNQTQLYDGIPSDLDGQQSNITPFFQAVSATTTNAPASSAVPGVINLVTFRGTNRFHGLASYKIYDSVLNASQYFPPPKTPYLQHEWNIGVGGPILKNKLFFYGGWFAQSIPLGTPFNISVPTLDYRQGVFSKTIIDPMTGQPFLNNTIPTSRISPVSLAIQNEFYPAPTGEFVNAPPVDNYPFVFPSNSDLYKSNWVLGRIDYNIAQNNSFFIRWDMRTTPYLLNDGVPNAIWTRRRLINQWGIGDTHIFSPHLVNNLRLGLDVDHIDDGRPERGKTPPDGAAVLQAIGLEGANPGNSQGMGLPTISISGLTTIQDVPGGKKADSKIDTVADAFNWQFGNHTLQFGFMYQHFRTTEGFVNNYGSFTFDGSVTGNAYADFLLGIPQSTARSHPLPLRSLFVGDFGAYAEDGFQVTKNLKLNYGLRWDYYANPSAPDNLMYNFDPATGNVVVNPKGISKVSPLYPSDITVVAGKVKPDSDKTNFAPRIGVAYRLTQNSVLRGGYALFTARLSNNAAGNNAYAPFLNINPQLGSTGPFSISEDYLNVVTPGQTPLLQFPNPFPASTSLAIVPSQTVLGYPMHSHLGEIQQFNITYQREVGKTGLRASYVGSRGSGLNYQVNTNLPHPSTKPFEASSRPFPQFRSTEMTKYDGSSKYDSMQFEALRRAGNLTYDATYTFQRSTLNYLDTENPYDVLSHWANDGVTMRHYASVMVSYNLPFGRGQRYMAASSPVLQRVVGGWNIMSLTYLGSGLWFSPSFDGSDPSNTGTFGGLPDRVGNPHQFSGGKQRLQNFNDAAFAVPQPGTFGNALPNSLESQGLYVTHLGIIKAIPITEHVTFNFDTNISNLFNHPEFLAPSGDISVPGGNQYTSQHGTFDSLERAMARQITFKGSITF